VLKNILGLQERSRPQSRTSTTTEVTSGLGMLPQGFFIRMLSVERKRMERSGRHFVLMLVDLGGLRASERVTTKLIPAVVQSTRTTDILGWYEDRKVMGVIFTEIGAADEKSAVNAISRKVTGGLYSALSIEDVNEIRLSFHVFPEDWDDNGLNGPATSTLQLALALESNRKENWLVAKRLMDVIGSAAAIILFLPLLLAIAIAVKLTSDGHVLFRQVRLGRCGRKFTFLKFRSMYVNNDHTIHKEYVERFIAGASGLDQARGSGQNVYKLTADPRVTRLGRFLRKTSLDELPQFFNVLKGDMSLVGPRPPVVYEAEHYDLWHRQRLAAVKPGITGLWQVEGRSRVNFDDMVRLDLRYARSWSIWLDIKILIRTPRAVLMGEGAY
jgi:lipopolysaccharide/colanic/teichoic acid biosynthesis glycosyltransferase